jgi:hypothetical protein
MKSTTRRTLTGPFLARDLGGGLWQVTARAAADPGTAAAAELYLRIPAATNAALLAQPHIRRIEVAWHADGVVVNVAGTGGAGVLEASSAIIHEPQNRLYDALPLAGFDARARRFWRRVFLLVRLPGGRYLLRLIARRKRP